MRLSEVCDHIMAGRYALVGCICLLLVVLPCFYIRRMWEYSSKSFFNLTVVIRVLWLYYAIVDLAIERYCQMCQPTRVNILADLFIGMFEGVVAGAGADEIGAGAGADVGAVGDRQNVHDSSVQSHVNAAIRKLQEHAQDTTSQSETIKQIKAHLTNASAFSALSALDSIVRINATIGEITEREILRLVWARIMSPVNDAIRTTLIENLTLQLCDMISATGELYCATGRAVRLIQTLEHADSEGIVNLKPEWAIKEEIASFFGKYRERFVAQLPLSAQKIFNEVLNPTPSQERFVKAVRDKMAAGIRRRLIKKYVDTGFITLNKFSTMTADYFAEI